MRKRIDELVFRFLNGELSDDEERETLHRVADDPDGRTLLKLELRLTELLSREDDAAVPEGFTDRTMAAVAELDEQRTASVWDTLQIWIDWLQEPRPIRVRPAYGLAVVLLVLVGVGLYGLQNSSTRPADAGPSTVERAPDRGVAQLAGAESGFDYVFMRFVYVDQEASSVAVAGDFSSWNPRPMRPRTVNGRTVWTTTLPLREGEHEYMFVINGEKWVTDPLASIQRDDGFGHKNAVITL